MQDLIEHLTACLNRTEAGGRYMVGIVGFPGAGKSTLSQKLVERVNAVSGKEVACVVPMDGFHLRNEILQERGLRPLKGVAETFDGEGFVALLQRLRNTTAGAVPCPAFDRAIDEPVADAIIVQPEQRLLVIEGNYLLLPQPPWQAIPEILDEVWYIDSDVETIVPRLIERHVLGGRSEEGARAKMECTDLPNARLIEQTRSRASRLIRVDQDEACFSDASMV